MADDYSFSLCVCNTDFGLKPSSRGLSPVRASLTRAESWADSCRGHVSRGILLLCARLTGPLSEQAIRNSVSPVLNKNDASPLKSTRHNGGEV